MKSSDLKTVLKGRVGKSLTIFILIAVAAYLLYAGSRSPLPRASAKAAPVTVTFAERGNLQRSIKIGGHLESESIVTVLPRVSGLLKDLDVTVGDEIGKGDLLARIDTESLNLQLQQAESAYKSSKSSFERVRNLYEANAASKQSYEEARTQYEAYKSQYDLARLQVNYASVTAPVDGVVLKTHASPGSLVAPEVPLVTIGDLDNILIRCKIPEKYYEEFLQRSEDFRIWLTRPESGTRREASIKSISPYISAESKNFELTARLEGRRGNLRPGMFVYTTFVLEEREDIHYLPYSIMASGDSVWYLDPEKNRARKWVPDPAFTTDDYFSIPEEYGKRPFITQGQHFLTDGQRVRILNPEIMNGDRETP